MVPISLKSSKCYKVRSISFPARGQQGTISTAEELKKLKSWLASSPLQADTVCGGLEALNQLYGGSMKQLLTSPQTSQALSNSQNEKWVTEMIQAGSIVYIDICSKARDAICQMRECAAELQSALRRNKVNEVIDVKTNVEAYAGFRKNMKKDMERSLAGLKQMENKSAGCSPHNQQTSSSHLLNVVRVLREASLATNLMFQKLLLFLSMPIMKPKPSRWSLANLVTKVANNGQQECCNKKNEFEEVDIEVMNLPIHSSTQVCWEDDRSVDSALEKLESLDASMKSIENELESLFKHLIYMRVTYLNIRSQ